MSTYDLVKKVCYNNLCPRNPPRQQQQEQFGQFNKKVYYYNCGYCRDQTSVNCQHCKSKTPYYTPGGPESQFYKPRYIQKK